MFSYVIKKKKKKKITALEYRKQILLPTKLTISAYI